MSADIKTFKEAFPAVTLTGQTAAVFDSVAVKSVKLNKEERVLKIELDAPFSVSEYDAAELKRQLVVFMPFISDVSLKFNHTAEDRQDDALSGLWGSVVKKIEEKCPVCASILRTSKRSLSPEGELTLIHGGSYMVKERGIDKMIIGMISEHLGQTVYFKYVNSTAAAKAPVLISPPPPAPRIKPDEKTIKPQKQNGKGKRLKRNDDIKGTGVILSDELTPDTDITVRGTIISADTREIKSGSLLITFDVTDGAGSVTVKFFTDKDAYKTDFEDLIKAGNNIAVMGVTQFDTYSNEINIMAREIGVCACADTRTDTAEHKRVELHLHTQMSALDGITTASDYIKRAALWGHKAIAITDHGVVQAFPEAAAAAKKYGVKVIYGMEAYLIDDINAARAVTGVCDKGLDDTFIVFDVETTGLNPKYCKIIEIGAVKIENLKITDTFSMLCDPGEDIPYNITQLTGISNEMVKGQPPVKEAVSRFLDFAGDNPLIAHNAAFDTGFLACAADFINPVIDTLALSRAFLPKLKKHSLKSVTEHFKISQSTHHRALADAEAAASVFICMAGRMRELSINNINGINAAAARELSHKALKHTHAIILVKNMTGLKHLYELVSDAHISNFYTRPRVLKSRYIELKEGLIIGSACEAGELFRALLEGASDKRIDELARFYDYYELQPRANNMFLLRNDKLSSERELMNINRQIIDLGERYNKPVAATCDAHFLDPGDEIIRRIIQYGEGYKDTDYSLPLFFRTTDEMMSEFDYLSYDKAYKAVVTDPNTIADMTEDISPIPGGSYPPVIEGSDELIKELAIKRAKDVYGDPLPDVVNVRLMRELDSIIKNGFAVMYLIAQKLVKYSEDNGYTVGSRGSVGSSFVATMTGITEVNPLSPHYLCPSCKYSDFESDIALSYAGGSGCDMPDKNCPNCGTPLLKDGHDIPFETFLGFDGDKEPDIDLNFSGEFQSKAHAYAEELFGTGHVFKSGTINTLADKNAYAAVKKYLDDKGLNLRTAEINRLKTGCIGIKKTTGQHPGGLMILPKGHSIYEFTPVQRPADKSESGVVTTHFDYHSISGRLFKLDLLGHDAPTIIRMLHEFTGVDPKDTDPGDKGVISLFTSTKALGVTDNDINCKTGSLGLPEFGTSFVRQMLIDSNPSSFAEIVRISGLSHGTDVWLNNAQDLIKSGQATLKTIIPSRDDIMLYLIGKGADKKTAFKIMENVRKGKGLSEADVNAMKECGVPDWYIKSCQTIKYLFPKGHAVAYVMMTMRIGYYKIHHPYAFYAAVFTMKAAEFDYEVMCFGKQKVYDESKRINALTKDNSTAKDKNTLTILELVLEFYARGLNFVPLDLYAASVDKFSITNEGLMAPLCSIQGLGITAALSVVSAREEGRFETLRDFRERTSVNKTVTEILKRVGVLEGLTETNQMSLF